MNSHIPLGKIITKVDGKKEIEHELEWQVRLGGISNTIYCRTHEKFLVDLGKKDAVFCGNSCLNNGHSIMSTYTKPAGEIKT